MLTNRGFKISDIEHYLHTTDNDILPPENIINIKEGAKLLISHINNNSNVLLIVDSDCDGYTSSAVLINYLNMLFPNYVQSNIKYQIHTGKQHGIILENIPEDINLIICADSSSNDYEQHQILKEKNIDVLVIDHHEAERISEYACVINNQLCNYPTKSLSGVGMVYKFCSYIDKLIGKESYADLFLDLVALGEIADVMNLQAFEVKRLIEKGLSNIRNPFFKGMVNKNAFSLGDTITPMGVAFYIAPYVNATIRVGTQEEKMLLFESMLDFKAYDLIPSTKRGCKGQSETRVEQACRTCGNVKNRQTKSRDNSLEVVEELIKENNLLNNKILAIRIPLNKQIDKNLTGLIANVLMDKYKRPVLLLNQTCRNDEVWWEGSGRGYDKSKLSDFRELLLNLDIESVGGYAQGHANAFGFGIPANYFDNLIERINYELKDFEFSPCYKVDFIYGMRDCNKEDILTIANLKSLWGQGIEEPKIVFEEISVSSNNILLMSPDKNPTIKILLPNGISCIKFKSSKEEFEALKPSDTGCIMLNIVGRCSVNDWDNNPQILIEDYEIAKVQKYYF